MTLHNFNFQHLVNKIITRVCIDVIWKDFEAIYLLLDFFLPFFGFIDDDKPGRRVESDSWQLSLNSQCRDEHFKL